MTKVVRSAGMRVQGFRLKVFVRHLKARSKYSVRIQVPEGTAMANMLKFMDDKYPAQPRGFGGHNWSRV